MKEELTVALRYSHMGLVMTLIIGGFTYGGYRLGRYYGWFTRGLAGGIIIGILFALAYFLFKTRKLIAYEVDKQDSAPGRS